MKSVLFVCLANICRSPLAMGLFLAKVEPEADLWKVASAGVQAMPGYPPALNTILVLRHRGIDLRWHRSTPISLEMVREFNLILTMDQPQKEALQAVFPDQAHKIYLLSEMTGQYLEIADPIGYPLVDFEATAQEIDAILSDGFLRISDLAEDR